MIFGRGFCVEVFRIGLVMPADDFHVTLREF